MPKSKVREKVRQKKKVAPIIEQMAAEDEKLESPSWLAPVMVTMFILGLLWIVVFYLIGSQVPLMSDLGNLTIVLFGFALIGIGFALATRWK